MKQFDKTSPLAAAVERQLLEEGGPDAIASLERKLAAMVDERLASLARRVDLLYRYTVGDRTGRHTLVPNMHQRGAEFPGGGAMSDAARAKALNRWEPEHTPVEAVAFNAGWDAAAEQTAALRGLLADAMPIVRDWQSQTGDYNKTSTWLIRARALLADPEGL